MKGQNYKEYTWEEIQSLLWRSAGGEGAGMAGLSSSAQKVLAHLANEAWQEVERKREKCIRDANALTNREKAEALAEFDEENAMSRAIMLQSEKLIGQVGCSYAPWALNAMFPVYDYLEAPLKQIAKRAANDLFQKDRDDYGRALAAALPKLSLEQNPFDRTMAYTTQNVGVGHKYMAAAGLYILGAAMPGYSLIVLQLAMAGVCAAPMVGMASGTPAKYGIPVALLAMGASTFGLLPAVASTPIVFAAITSTAVPIVLLSTVASVLPKIMTWNNVAAIGVVAASYIATNSMALSPFYTSGALATLGCIGCLLGYNEPGAFRSIGTSSLLAAGMAYFNLPSVIVAPVAAVAATAVSNGITADLGGVQYNASSASTQRMLNTSIMACGVALRSNPIFSAVCFAAGDIIGYGALKNIGREEMAPIDVMDGGGGAGRGGRGRGFNPEGAGANRDANPPEQPRTTTRMVNGCIVRTPVNN